MASTLNAKMDRLLEVMDREPLGAKLVSSMMRRVVLSSEANKLVLKLEALESFIGIPPKIGSVSFIVIAVHACLREVVLYANGLRFNGDALTEDGYLLAITILTKLDTFLLLIMSSAETPAELKPVATDVHTNVIGYVKLVQDRDKKISLLTVMLVEIGKVLVADNVRYQYLKDIGAILSK